LTIPERRNLLDSIPPIFLAASWFGIVAGVVEGIIFLVVQNFGQIRGVSADILWISPIINLVLFNLVALFWLFVGAVFRNLNTTPAWIFSFIFLAILSWFGIIFFTVFYEWAVFLLSLGLAFQLSRMINKSTGLFLSRIRMSLGYVLTAFLIVLVGVPAIGYIREKIATGNLEPVRSNMPNVILIVMDTVRADHLSAYGYERETSPFLEQLANEGVLFENAIAPSSNSLPSHASIFTGQYVNEHGIDWSNPMGYKKFVAAVLPEELEALGYRTGGFSANLYWVTRGYGFDRGFIHFEDYNQTIESAVFSPFYGRLFERFVLRPLGSNGALTRRWADEINDSVIAWLDKDLERPFFIFINYIDAHEPYVPPQPFRSKFSNQPSPGGILDCDIGKCDRTLTQADRQSEMDAYDGAIAFLDEQIQQLFSGLERLGKLDNTLVMIVSDHGEGFNEHGMYLHQHSLYREAIRVPLILWWKEMLPAGKHIFTPVSIAGIPSTVMSLLDMNSQSEHSVFSFAELWKETGSAKSWEPVLSNMGPDTQINPNRTDNGWINSLVDGSKHYLEFEYQPEELFDWNSDPLESNNLANQTAQVTVLRNLVELLDKILAMSDSAPTSP